ncbi:hypothetical protein AB0I52_26585 [Streptomyces sp. NPDC050423]
MESEGPQDVLVWLVIEADPLSAQLRDRVLDGVAAAGPVPDRWPPG